MATKKYDSFASFPEGEEAMINIAAGSVQEAENSVVDIKKLSSERIAELTSVRDELRREMRKKLADIASTKDLASNLKNRISLAIKNIESEDRAVEAAQAEGKKKLGVYVLRVAGSAGLAIWYFISIFWEGFFGTLVGGVGLIGLFFAFIDMDDLDLQPLAWAGPFFGGLLILWSYSLV